MDESGKDLIDTAPGSGEAQIGTSSGQELFPGVKTMGALSALSG